MRALTVVALVLTTAAADHETDVLRRYGVRPDADGIGRYLRTLYPDAATLKTVEVMVSALGSENPERRADAQRALSRLGAAPIAALEKAVRHTDPEVARSARRMLVKAREFLRAEVIYCAFRTISRRSIPGLVEEVIQTLLLSPERYVRDAGQLALAATARRAGVARLRRLLRDGSEAMKVPAIRAIARALGMEARADLVGVLDHKSDRVRAAAAWELADLADRVCFPTLSQLLDSKDIAARLQAWRALRAIAGRRFGYAPYESAEARKPATAAWRVWIRLNEETVQWTVPLSAADAALGRFLVSTGGANRVVELDHDGTKLWEVAAVNPWCCSGARNGHRLITHFDKSLVIEYDDGGKEVWRQQLPGKACSVQRLDNGNTLVAIGSVNKVIEYRPNGSIAWELAVSGRPFFARRLATGMTVVSLHDKGLVVEVSRQKKIKERFSGLRGPYSAHPLANGNWLICMPGSGRVVELTPAGKEIWSVGKLGWPASAHRLESGATVIGHRGGVEKFLPTGERRMILRVTSGSVFISRY